MAKCQKVPVTPLSEFSAPNVSILILHLVVWIYSPQFHKHYVSKHFYSKGTFPSDVAYHITRASPQLGDPVFTSLKLFSYVKDCYPATCPIFGLCLLVIFDGIHCNYFCLKHAQNTGYQKDKFNIHKEHQQTTTTGSIWSLICQKNANICSICSLIFHGSSCYPTIEL